ncbi:MULTISPECIES: hypothetical protein [unclassified Endozoicomonas]|uniref:hypothetical protein n=1 Tax=unclassified Endozoicomonas TaxID=2644528 RepID=UPI003BB4C6BC
MPEYKYSALTCLHEKPSDEELTEWHKVKCDVVTGQSFFQRVNSNKPIRTRKDRRELRRQVKKEQDLCAISIAMDYIHSAEQGRDDTSGYQLMESSLFALTTAVKILNDHPKLWDKYSQQVYGGHFLPPPRVGIETLRYLGRGLEKVINGTDVEQALNLKGKKGKLKPTPENLLSQDNDHVVRSAVALMVHVYKRHESISMEEIFIEVSELFDMHDRENTVKDWYRKYLGSDEEYLNQMSDRLKNKGDRIAYAIMVLDDVSKMSKSALAHLQDS